MSTATGWTHMNVWLELPRKSNWYQMLKGYSNERFKQRTGVGCNRTSRETCRNKFKKEQSKLFGRSRRRANLRELADQFGASRFIDLDDPGVSQFPDHSRGCCNYHPATYRGYGPGDIDHRLPHRRSFSGNQFRFASL